MTALHARGRARAEARVVDVAAKKAQVQAAAVQAADVRAWVETMQRTHRRALTTASVALALSVLALGAALSAVAMVAT